MHYKITILDTMKSIIDIEEQWTNLQYLDSEYTLYQSFNWVKNYCKYLLNNKTIYIVAFYLKDRLIGAFPLQLRLFRNIEIVEFMGSHGVDYLMPIIIDCYKDDIYHIFCKWLGTQPQNRVFVFEDIPTNHSFSKHIQENKYNYYIKTFLDYIPCYTTELPQSWNKYKSNLSKRMQHDIEYDRRYIKNRMKIDIVDLPCDRINEHFDLNVERMHSKNLKSPFDEQSSRLFWQKFYIDEYLSGRLSFEAIVSDSQIISSIVSINIGKTKFLSSLNINVEYSKLSPGNVLIGYIFESSIKNNYKKIDFGRGNDNYKRRFGASEFFNSRYIISTNKKNHELYCNQVLYLYNKIGYYLTMI